MPPVIYIRRFVTLSPERLAGCAQGLVLLDISQISHCAALVHGADCVALHCLLLHGAHMRLGK